MVLKVLDLFSGSKSVQKAVDDKLARFFEVTSLDLARADINIDILDWDYQNEFKPGDFDVIWCSPPCTFFSPLRRCNIGRFGITAESIEEDIQNKGIPLLRKSEEIIEYFKPKFYFIENGMMSRLKNFVAKNPTQFYTVDYCSYGFEYRKRTNIWTNLPRRFFEPQLCEKDCGSYNFETNRHKKQVNDFGGGTNALVTGGRCRRSAVPARLIQSLFVAVLKEMGKIG